MVKLNSKSKRQSAGGPRLLKTVVKKYKLSTTSPKDDLKYWLSKSPDERISAVEILRRQHYVSTPRLRRIARITKRASRKELIQNKKATGRTKDLADIEALKK
jgi:hypothetical protein